MIGIILAFWSIKWTVQWIRSNEVPKRCPMEKNVFKWFIFVVGYLALIGSIGISVESYQHKARLAQLQTEQPGKQEFIDQFLSPTATTRMISPTSTQIVDTDEQSSAYIDFLYENASQCNDAMDPFYSKMEQITEGDITRDQSFDNELLRIVDQIELYCTNLYQGNLPTVWSSTNNYYIQARREYQIFVDDFRRAILENDSDAAGTAIDHWNNGNSFLKLAADEMDKVPYP